MKPYVCLIAAIALLPLMAFAPPSPAPPASGPIVDGVSAFDADHNAALDRNEWKKAAQDTFRTLDSDKDGTVSGEEFALLHGAMFAAIDANHDGMMSPQEIEAYKRLPWTLRISR